MRVYVISKGKFASVVSEEYQSGYLMAWVHYEDGNEGLIDSSDYINVDRSYSNADIWYMFEKNNIQKEIRIIEKKKNKMAGFNLKKFIGADFEIGDRWTLDRVID